MGNPDFLTPMYMQLREILRNKIEEQEYPPGTAIPSENELAQTYGINRLTVRNAIEALVNEGMLKPIQGKGVYVLGEKVQRDLDSLSGFTQTMVEKKAHPTTNVLVKSIRKAGGKYSRIFNISPDDELYYIKRVCYASGEPFSLEEILIPKYIVPKLIGIDLGVFSIYEVYDFYGIELKHAHQTMDLTTLEQSDARTLGIDSNLSVMLFECTSYDTNNRVIEFARTYTRADKAVFSVKFNG